MKKSMINSVHIEGVLYSHNLEAKVTGENSKAPGTPYVAGTIDIATDDAQTNVVSVHFTYVTPTYAKSGKPNPNYQILMDIINGKTKSVTANGEGAKLRIDSVIALNEFYSDRNGEEELVSVSLKELMIFIHSVMFRKTGSLVMDILLALKQLISMLVSMRQMTMSLSTTI